MVSSSESADGTRETMRVQTYAGAQTRSAADGSFRLLVDRPGMQSVGVFATGYEQWKSADGFTVSQSRDDFVIELKHAAVAGEVRVKLQDAATGDPLPGALMFLTRRSGQTNFSGMSSMGGTTAGHQHGPEPGGSMSVIAHVPGRGLALRDGIEHSETDIDIILRLAPGGSARILLPDGMLTPERMLVYRGALRLQIGAGFDLGPPNVNIQLNLLSRIMSQVSPSEWLIRDLPAGLFTLTLGEGAPRTVEIVPGDVVEVDLR